MNLTFPFPELVCSKGGCVGEANRRKLHRWNEIKRGCFISLSFDNEHTYFP